MYLQPPSTSIPDTLFPYTTLVRSVLDRIGAHLLQLRSRPFDVRRDSLRARHRRSARDTENIIDRVRPAQPVVIGQVAFPLADRRAPRRQPRRDTDDVGKRVERFAPLQPPQPAKPRALLQRPAVMDGQGMATLPPHDPTNCRGKA